jgi:hypothetical protein
MTAIPRSIWEMKRCIANVRRIDYETSFPFVSGDDFRAICDFVLDDNGLAFLPSQVHENALIFVKAYPSLVDYFFRQIHPRIRTPYRLITHNGDYSLPAEHAKHLNDPKLLAWYSTNLTCQHTKVVALPIGILNRRAKSDNHNALSELISSPRTKINKVYLNFHIGNAMEKAEYRAYRQAVHDRFSNCSWVQVAERVSTREYLESIATYQFVISPSGHGPDCYRHWEAMYLGAIPIVERSAGMEHFSGFPLILVDDWSQVNPGFLETQKDLIESRNFDRSKLFLDYWKRLFN